MHEIKLLLLTFHGFGFPGGYEQSVICVCAWSEVAGEPALLKTKTTICDEQTRHECESIVDEWKTIWMNH